MKFKSFFLILFSGLVVGCASDPKYAVKQPFLYEVKKGDQVGHLFGTIHMGVAADDLPENFWAYFDSADVFAFEINLSEYEKQKSERRWKRKSSEPSISKYLSPEYVNKLRTYLNDDENYQKFAQNLEIWRPSFLFELTVYKLFDESGETIPHGEAVRLKSKFMMDRSLMERAAKLERTVSYLDEGIISKLESCLDEERPIDAEVLKGILDGKITANGIYTYEMKVIQDYREGSSEKIRDMSKRLQTQFHDCILRDRNEHWMFTIKTLFENYDKPMIAVGVGHLESGDHTLPILLRKEGYEVRRVVWP